MCREKIKWSISRKVIGLEAKYPRNVVKMKEEMTAFFSQWSVVMRFCCRCERLKYSVWNVLWCVIMDAGTVSKTQRLDPFGWNRRCDRWNWSQDKKVGHFHLLICLVQVSCNSRIGTTRNKMSMEEKFLGFVLVYKSACTELYGSVRFVKRLNLFWAINRHDWVLQLD